MAPSPFLAEEAKWSWVPDFDDTIEQGQFVIFRKIFVLEEVPIQEYLLQVSADTRYRLFLNGQSGTYFRSPPFSKFECLVSHGTFKLPSLAITDIENQCSKLWAVQKLLNSMVL